MEYSRKYGMGGNVDRLRMAFGGKMEYADEGRKMPSNFVGRKRGRDADTPYNDKVAMEAGIEIDYSDKYRYLTEQEKEYAIELESAGLLRTSGKGGGYITPQSMENLMSPKARLAMASMMRQIKNGEEPGGKSFGRGRIETGGVKGSQRATRPAIVQLAPPRGYVEEEGEERNRMSQFAGIGPDGRTIRGDEGPAGFGTRSPEY